LIKTLPCRAASECSLNCHACCAFIPPQDAARPGREGGGRRRGVAGAVALWSDTCLTCRLTVCMAAWHSSHVPWFFIIFRRTQNNSPFSPPARSDWFVFCWQRHLNLFPTSAGVAFQGRRRRRGRAFGKAI